MAKARRGVPSLPNILKLVVLAVLGLFVAWLCVRTYLPRAMPQFARIGSENPALLYRQAGQQLLATKGRLDDAAYQRLRHAALLDPLASEPFVFFGLRAAGANDLASAERFLEEARRRDPRDRLARIGLIGVYLQSKRVKEGADEVAALSRFEPRVDQLLAPHLLRLAVAPATSNVVLEAVGDQPIMATILDQLVKGGADPDLVLRLSARQPRLPNGALAAWQENQLGKLMSRGEVARAHQLWGRFVGNADTSSLIYDGKFEGRPGPPPFNWELTASDVGAAERARGPALEIEYFGRKPGVLARQLLVLRPGRYEVSMSAEGSAAGRASKIILKIACQRDDRVLLETPLQGLSAAPRRIAGQFTVGGGCNGQWISLAGSPGEFPETHSVRITDLSVRPAGSSQ